MSQILPPHLKGRAILLVSGQSSISVIAEFGKALGEYVVSINDRQEILMCGRVIAAIDFACDPAHLPAIDADLLALARSKGLDLAIEQV